MKKWRFLSLLLTLVLLLCATACGSDDEKKKTDKENDKDTGKESVSAADSLYDLVDEAKSLIDSGDYAAAYLLLKEAPLPEGDFHTPEYTMITSLLDKFAFVPITAQIETGSGRDDSSCSFEYDDNDRLVRITEQFKDLNEQEGGWEKQTRVTTFEHNRYGDCTAITRNDEILYAYTYEYDSQGRVISKVEENHEYGDRDVTTYTYTYADEGYLQVEHVYYESEEEDYRKEYIYNADGSLYSEESTYPGNEHTTTYQYNKNGYIVRAESAYNDGDTMLYIFNEGGKPLKNELSGGSYAQTTEYIYDSHGNLIQINQEMKEGSLNQTYSEEFTYTYDKDGNVLTYADKNGETYSSTYDTSGNRVSKTSDGTKWVYTYNTEGYLSKTQIYYDGDLGPSATFDKFGNMLSYNSDDQSGTWSYRLVYYPDGVPECVKYGERDASGFFETFMFFE